MANNTRQQGENLSTDMRLDQASGRLTLRLQGRLDWKTAGPVWQDVLRRVHQDHPREVVVEAQGLHYCDASGIGLLLDLQIRGEERGYGVQIRGLGDSCREMMEMFEAGRFREPPPDRIGRANAVEEVGRQTAHVWEDFKEQVSFLGELAAALGRTAVKPWRVRWGDTLEIAERAGANAVGIVCLLGFLFGLIMAFSSAMPMRQFGVEVFVADLAAMALVRVLGPFITAVIVAGRSGSAFAAELGTMKINNEIDALEVMGLDPVRFLVVPRVIATTVVTPLLAILANLAGLVGTGLVMVSLGFSLQTYKNHVTASITTTDVWGGLFKAMVYGTIISAIGCLRGLQTTTGASAVGVSTTRAVVSGIILIVVAEGIFAILFHSLGI